MESQTIEQKQLIFQTYKLALPLSWKEGGIPEDSLKLDAKHGFS
jgi:hypothetical protein